MSWIKTILADRMNSITELAEEIEKETDQETKELWENCGGYTKKDTDEALYDICMDTEAFELLMRVGTQLIRNYKTNRKNKNNI